MVVGYHLLWTAYGWWLPNDPRGSCSHEIRVEQVAELGELHHGRKRVQPKSCEIRTFYEQAREVLQHELLQFNCKDVEVMAQRFCEVIARQRYTCYACALMPDHVHILIRKHRHRGEEMIQHLQDGSRQALIEAGRRPAEHPVWGGPGWKVFLNTREDIERIIRYIRDNPIKARLPEQNWAFVKVYDGWLPGGCR